MNFYLILRMFLPVAAWAHNAPLPPQQLTPPVHIGEQKPCAEYSQTASVASRDGKTLLTFKVTAKGEIADIAVTKSSGNAALDGAAIACARQWQYQPATLKGKSVEASGKAAVAWPSGAVAPAKSALN